MQMVLILLNLVFTGLPLPSWGMMLQFKLPPSRRGFMPSLQIYIFLQLMVAKPSAGIRRNLQALSKEERQQYFWCLKMLGILPPFQAMKQRCFHTLGTEGPKGSSAPYNQVQPTCLHDELIASHVTCCEHGSFFFAYFHRHLMVHLEMRLNYADECLRLGPQQFSQKYPGLYNLSPKRWDQIFKEYLAIAPMRKKVMAHYWNPTNYNNRDDVVIPPEIANPNLFPLSKYKADNIDELYNLARGSYPYEINVKTRWYDTPQHYEEQRTQFIQKMSDSEHDYFNRQLFSYTQQEKKMVSGDYNARKNQNFQQFLKDYVRMSSVTEQNGFLPNTYKKSTQREYEHFVKTQHNMCLQNQEEGQILMNYGGRFGSEEKEHGMQYFSEKQLSRGSIADSDKRAYNQMLPHYQLGYVLLNSNYSKLVDFLSPTQENIVLETSHNTMHNNSHFCMSDGSLSLANLMFFPFHSWIDVELQLKVRMCDNPVQAYFMNKKLTGQSQKGHKRFGKLLKSDSQYGSYPILEWVHPQLAADNDVTPEKVNKNNVKVAFSSYNYIMKHSSSLRTSLGLQQIYQPYFEDKAALFSQFVGLKQFDANYDYQMFETSFDEDSKQLTNHTNPMGNYPNVAIPQYLLAMESQVNQYNNNLSSKILTLRQHESNPRSEEYYRKIVDRGLLMLLKYRSTIANGIYVLSADLKHLKNILIERGSPISNEDRQFMQTQKLTVLVLSLFGKSSEAELCISCSDHKHRLINMNEQLYDRYHIIWSQLNSLLLRQVIYDSTEIDPSEEKDVLDVRKFIDISIPRDDLEVVYIEGAEQVLFDVTYLTDLPAGKPSSFNLELCLQTVRVQNGKANNKVVSQIDGADLTKSQSLPGNAFVHKFNFYRMEDSNSSLDQDDLDGLVYSRVVGNVFVDGLSHRFSFRIRQYHEIVRYWLTITKTEGEVEVRVEDADFRFKKELFKSDQL